MKVSLPDSWPLAKLGVCLRRRKDTIMPSTLGDPIVGLVGLEDIQDGGRGGITVIPTKPSEIDSLKTRFQKGDILYGKLRPYLNKVGIAQTNGLCSTEIWAFTTEPFLDARFAAYYLASSFFVNRVESLTKGANLPRLDSESFDSISIPLPPLSEQQRIVDILQEAEEIRRLRAQAEAKTTELIPALFYQGLGKQLSERKKPLGHWFETNPNYGTMTPADENPGSDGLFCLRVGNIQNNRIDLSDRKYVQRGSINLERHTVRTGDIILARAIASEEHLGKAVVITPEEDGFAFDSHLMRIRVRKVELLPEFLQVYLYSAPGRNAFLKQARQSAVQFNVNAQEMARVMVPDVPPPQQMEVIQGIKETESLCRHLESTTSLGSQLTASLAAHAFTGQLTEEWREANKKKLVAEARDRDSALGAAVPLKDAPPAIKSFMFGPDTLEEINEEQHRLYNHIQRLRHPAQVSELGGKRLPEYFTADLLAQKLGFAPFGGNSALIAGHLAVLAARGALIPVSREEQAKDTGEYVFGNAYRLYRKDKHELLKTDQGEAITTEKGEGIIANTIPGDHARGRELQRLADRLEKERLQP